MAKKFRQETVESSMKYYQKMYERLIGRGLPVEQAQYQATLYTAKRALRYGAVLLLKKIADKVAIKDNLSRQERPIVYAFVNEVARALLEMGENEDINTVVRGIYAKHIARVGNTNAAGTIKKLYRWLASVEKRGA